MKPPPKRYDKGGPLKPAEPITLRKGDQVLLVRPDGSVIPITYSGGRMNISRYVVTLAAPSDNVSLTIDLTPEGAALLDHLAHVFAERGVPYAPHLTVEDAALAPEPVLSTAPLVPPAPIPPRKPLPRSVRDNTLDTRIGDPSPVSAGLNVLPCLRRTQRPFICSANRAHVGPHVAYGKTGVAYVWDNEGDDHV